MNAIIPITEKIVRNIPFNFAISSSLFSALNLLKKRIYPLPNPRLKIDKDEITEATVLYSPYSLFPKIRIIKGVYNRVIAAPIAI